MGKEISSVNTIPFAARSQEPPFLPIDENRLAISALTRLWEENPTATVPSFVYLYGPSGSGKTGLIRWFLTETSRKNQPLPPTEQMRAVHLTAAMLVENFDRAVDCSTLEELRDDYSSCDLFICEDLLPLVRYSRAQSFLVSIIDRLLAENGSVILSAISMPSEMGKLTAQFKNRCRSASCTEIANPGKESTLKLIANFTKDKGIILTTKATELLATFTTVSPRELLAIITQLKLLAQLAKTNTINEEIVQRYLASNEQRPRLTISHVARYVARHFGVSVKSLREPSRQQSRVLARQCAMFLSRKLSGKPLTEIAKYFGKKNHSTVIHACQRMAKQLINDTELRHDINCICSLLYVPYHLVISSTLPNNVDNMLAES